MSCFNLCQIPMSSKVSQSENAIFRWARSNKILPDLWRYNQINTWWDLSDNVKMSTQLSKCQSNCKNLKQIVKMSIKLSIKLSKYQSIVKYQSNCHNIHQIVKMSIKFSICQSNCQNVNQIVKLSQYQMSCVIRVCRLT